MRLIFLLFFVSTAFAQDEDKKQTYTDILHSKNQIVAAGSIGISPSNFIEKDFRVGNWKAINYNTQWANYSYGLGEMKRERLDGSFDTVAMREFTIGGNFSIKKLALGSRLYDMRGAMMLPYIGASIGQRTVEETHDLIGKITPAISFQFPFCAIDLKLNTSFTLKHGIDHTKGFAFTPEIAFKFDGLYNLLDAESVYIGHAEGTITSRNTSYSTTSHREGDYIITTTYKTETTTVTPYSFDRYATVIGPMVAIGPHVSFSNHPYAGLTRMYGLGYYLRLGILSTDFLVDAGKIGFGASLKESQTIDDPSPKFLVGVNKEDFSNRGTYNSTRIQARLGIDLVEILASMYGSGAVVSRENTKFSRVIGGIGYGYATISAPHFSSSEGKTRADAHFDNDLTLLSTSGNHPEFATNSNFISFYASLEAGAIRLTFEATRYQNAQLANVGSISVGYMFPYNRIKKKLKAIRSYENYIETH